MKNNNKEYVALNLEKEVRWMFKKVCDKEKIYTNSEFMIKLLELWRLSKIKKEGNMYIKGFKDGFKHSSEGFNGEYTHLDVEKDFLEKDAREALSSIKPLTTK